MSSKVLHDLKLEFKVADFDRKNAVGKAEFARQDTLNPQPPPIHQPTLPPSCPNALTHTTCMSILYVDRCMYRHSIACDDNMCALDFIVRSISMRKLIDVCCPFTPALHPASCRCLNHVGIKLPGATERDLVDTLTHNSASDIQYLDFINVIERSTG